MTMQLTPKIVLEILSHEAMVRQTYKDSVGVSTWSVCILCKPHDGSNYGSRSIGIRDHSWVLGGIHEEAPSL